MDLHPSQYHQGLTQERLEVIAKRLLEIVNSALESHNHKFDDGYTRGCCFFGRARNSLLDMVQKTPWMGCLREGNDITPTIDGIPFRFAREHDVDNPRKAHVFRLSPYEVDQLSLEFGDQETELVKCRFYVKAPLSHKGDMMEAEELSEPRIVFHGFNKHDVRLFSWEYQKKVRTLHSVDSRLPEAVETPEPSVTLPKVDVGDKKEVAGNPE